MGLSRLFRDRQIIVRSAEGVEYLKLSAARQKFYAGATLLTFATVTSLSIANATSTTFGEWKAAGLDLAQTAYERILGRIGEQEPGEYAQSDEADAETSTQEMTPEERVADLERRLEEAEAERRRIAGERDKLEAERAKFASSASAADKRAAALAAQQEAIQQLITRARAALERTQKGVTSLGLEPSRFVAAGRAKGGTGGPFIDFRRAGRGHPAHSDLVTLGQNLDKLTELQHAVRALPIGAPISRYSLTSPWGVRRDPFNNQPAMHNGLDMAAPKGTEIKARAPGKVTFAGRNGVYGNMVEIDHGHGIRTRYGHMSAIAVQKGQKVAARDKLGAVGSTGRSTAPHLHYEVLFRGKTLDPRKFVEAKQNVFQN
jgi:murein DD-endopeptidase MepM/ murein hydrolase activator NlpD